jgi:dienelactone hydrolase
MLMLVAASACSSPAPEPVPEPASATPAAPDVQTREVTYAQNGTTLTGLMAWDANITDPRPGVLVVHEWWGHDAHTRNQALRLAEAGYVAFALDMYGDGKLAEHPEDAQRFMAEATADPAVVAARFAAARQVLTQDPHVRAGDLAAIGYCFGGAVVLDRARGGADLDAVVSFHGLLSTATPAQPGQVTSRVLVLTGDADEFVPAAQVEAFRQEMTAAGANFNVVVYPGAKHGFTNPNAADHGMTQLGHDADADQQSWRAMLDLFAGGRFRRPQ